MGNVTRAAGHLSEDEIRKYRATTPILAEEDIDIPIDELKRRKSAR